MTVIRLKSGGLFIHNAIAMDEAGYAALDKLGQVEVIVAPNAFHGSDAPVYKNRYPKAQLFMPKGALFQCEEIESLFVSGMRLVDETVFFHRPSRTLIVTDLVFNMQNEPKGMARFVYRLNLIHKRFGPSRVLRYLLTKDVKVLAKSVREILDWNFERVIMNHGTILETGGPAAVKKGFLEIGIPV